MTPWGPRSSCSLASEIILARKTTRQKFCADLLRDDRQSFRIERKLVAQLQHQLAHLAPDFLIAGRAQDARDQAPDSFHFLFPHAAARYCRSPDPDTARHHGRILVE